MSSKFTNILETGSGDPNERSGDVDQFQQDISSADTLVGDIEIGNITWRTM